MERKASSGLYRERFHARVKRERSHSLYTDRGSPNSPFLEPEHPYATHNGVDEASATGTAPAVEANEATHSPRVLLFELVPLSGSPSSALSGSLKFGVEGLRIGRDPSCSDLVLNSAAVSRLHCVLSVLGGEVFVHDNSFNGTFINGRRVGRGRCSMLHPRDTISFMNPTCADAARYSFELASLPGCAASVFSGIEGMERYELGPVVGQGSFAAVRLATDLETGDAVAVKLIERRRLCSEEAAVSLHTEIEMMRGMNHPNIVKVLDAFEGNGCVALVMEYVRGGDLFDYVVGRGRNPFTEVEARYLFVQLLEALLYIHGRNIIHCDLKPENVLVDVVAEDRKSQPLPHPPLTGPALKPASVSSSCDTPAVPSVAAAPEEAVALSALDDHQSEAKSLSPFDVRLKLTDFGVAKYAGGAAEEAAEETGGVCGGTPVYAAPELACFVLRDASEDDDGQNLAGASLPSVKITSAVDVWSLGVLLFILCSGTVPTPPPLGTPVVLHRCMSHLSASCTDLILRMMVADPAQRITLAGICHHPWLDGVELRGGARATHENDEGVESLSVTAIVSPRFFRPSSTSTAGRGKRATLRQKKKGVGEQGACPSVGSPH
jgi:serine/threonine protein kinase